MADGSWCSISIFFFSLHGYIIYRFFKIQQEGMMNALRHIDVRNGNDTTRNGLFYNRFLEKKKYSSSIPPFTLNLVRLRWARTEKKLVKWEEL